VTKIGTEVAHVIHDSRHHFKGQGHQAAFLTAALTCEAGERWPWERIGRGKLLLHCVCSAAPTGERRGGISCRHAHSLLVLPGQCTYIKHRL